MTSQTQYIGRIIAVLVLFSLMSLKIYQDKWVQWITMVPGNITNGGGDGALKGIQKIRLISSRINSRIRESVVDTHLDVRSMLAETILNVEEGVLKMDIIDVVETAVKADLKDNRLISKLQRALKHRTKPCIIRVIMYCGGYEHCLRFLGNASKHLMTSRRFSCSPSLSLPCDIETRFVGNMTSVAMNTSDVVVFMSSLHEELRLGAMMAMRPPGQLWALCTRESPQHDPEYSPRASAENPYNLTMTYSHEADLHSPYCYFKKEPVNNIRPLPKKTKLMAWMASNCHYTSWKRTEFVENLQKHLNVDTYGTCGQLGNMPYEKIDTILRKYKFYLALENSECREYITEKVWRNSLLKGVVPIVYGSRRDDYERALPANSYINVEDFDSMADFLKYINVLNTDAEQYNKFLEWRKEGSVVCSSARSFLKLNPAVNICYLLRKLVHVFVHPETSRQKKSPDFRLWWQGQCSNVSARKMVLGFNVH